MSAGEFHLCKVPGSLLTSTPIDQHWDSHAAEKAGTGKGSHQSSVVNEVDAP